MLRGVLGNQFSDNICGQIVSEHTDRLELIRVTTKDKTIQEWMDDFWQKAKWDDLQARTHRATIRDGNFCLAVQYNYDKRQIAIHREHWWDGSTGVFIGYDVFGDMLYAVKQWLGPIGIFRNVYYDGMIERYVSNGGSLWSPYLMAADMAIPGFENMTPGKQQTGDPIGIPYVDGDGNPLHIPFIHFPNPGDEFDNYGESILDGGLTGNQDQVNDARYDIVSAARMTGYQRTWSKGYKLQMRNGKAVAPRSGPGVHYHATEETAAWGAIQAGDISQLINVYENTVKAMCRMTATPLNSITGNWPSGEAVFKIEQPIRGATKTRQKRFAPQWVEVMHRCIELANAIDHEGLDETELLNAEFRDAGDRDPMVVATAELSLWQAANFAVQAGMPLETFLKVQGWGEDAITGLTTDIDEVIKARQAEMAQNFGTSQGNVIRGGPNGSPNAAIKPSTGSVAHTGKKG